MHGSAILNEIETKKPRHEKILQEKNNETVCRSNFDPRVKVDRKTNPIIDNDLHILADATDRRCEIVMLMRKHNVRPNSDINDVSSCIEVTTIKHTETPKSIYDLVDEYKYLNSNLEEYDHDFISF